MIEHSENTDFAELVASLATQGAIGRALEAAVEGFRELSESDDEAQQVALSNALQAIEAVLEDEPEAPTDILGVERAFVRQLLASYRLRESAPGGCLSHATGGIAISPAEVAGLIDGGPAPLEVAGHEAAARHLRALADRLWEQRALAGQSAPAWYLSTRFGLDSLDLAILMVLAAAAHDSRFDRVYRYAWQDYTRRTADVAFIANMLTPMTTDEDVVVLRLMPSGTLVRDGLVEVAPPGDQPRAAWPHRLVSLAPSVAEFLRGNVLLDPLLSGAARLGWPDVELDGLVLPAGIRDALERIYPAGAAQFNIRTLLVGARGAGKRTLAEAMAYRDSRPLIELEISSTVAPGRLEQLRAAVRECRMHRGLLYVRLQSQSDLDSAERSLCQDLATGLEDTIDIPIALGCRTPPKGLFEEVGDLCELPVTGFGTDELIELWARNLRTHGLASPEESALVQAACQPGLTPGMVQRAAAEVNARALAEGIKTPNDESLRQAVRNQIAMGLAGVAQRVTTTMDWDDFVLPEDLLTQLEDIIVHLRYADQVFDDWGFAGRFPYGKGLLCLFSGPPGTGKTMAAGVIAREVGTDLFRVDLSQVLSNWVGETEKTLARIFDEAERARAALLFDEADSMFGRRTEQRTSSDRYGNLEVNYLLQRVESYEGLVILTTNFEENIDDAFKRRLRFSIPFPFPDEAARKKIWQVLLPSEADLEDDLEFDELAERFELAGGNIKNAVLRAAFAAAKDARPIGHEHLIRAAQQEYRGMGKLVRDEE